MRLLIWMLCSSGDCICFEWQIYYHLTSVYFHCSFLIQVYSKVFNIAQEIYTIIFFLSVHNCLNCQMLHILFMRSNSLRYSESFNIKCYCILHVLCYCILSVYIWRAYKLFMSFWFILASLFSNCFWKSLISVGTNF